jgi:phage terminase large subunit
MNNSMQSLQALPKKQVLASVLAEKARRFKAAQELARNREAAERLRRTDDERPQVSDTATSLVLDRDHPLSDLYYRRAPYKVYWGGRGSAKSWGVAEALIRKASESALRILCTRQFQNKIQHSSHKMLKDTIIRLGLSAWFTVTDTSIKSHVGSEFIFQGLHGNDQGIRSLEGIDITWVEEAQTTTASSWQSLTATVRRKAGAEIWVTFNLISEDDATYVRLVVNERPNSIVHKVNYDSNPYFPDGLREEMETDKATDYDLYEHIWLGMPLKKSNAIVLSGKYRVEAFADDLWKTADRVLYGADFGFAEDPSTLIRFFMLPSEQNKGKMRLYIEHEAYGKHVELDDMPDFYAGDAEGEQHKYPGIVDARNWPIKADAAAPATISKIRRHGFNISAAEKWPGSVEDGVRFLKSFDQITIHPRCTNTAKEAYLWRYKTDPVAVDERGQPLVLPVLKKGNDHCWDGVRYGLDGYITRGGALGVWARLGAQQAS